MRVEMDASAVYGCLMRSRADKSRMYGRMKVKHRHESRDQQTEQIWQTQTRASRNGQKFKNQNSIHRKTSHGEIKCTGQTECFIAKSV